MEDWPTSRLSKMTVRWRAAKAGTCSVHAVVSAARPITASSGSPSPCIS